MNGGGPPANGGVTEAQRWWKGGDGGNRRNARSSRTGDEIQRDRSQKIRREKRKRTVVVRDRGLAHRRRINGKT